MGVPRVAGCTQHAAGWCGTQYTVRGQVYPVIQGAEEVRHRGTRWLAGATGSGHARHPWGSINPGMWQARPLYTLVLTCQPANTAWDLTPGSPARRSGEYGYSGRPDPLLHGPFYGPGLLHDKAVINYLTCNNDLFRGFLAVFRL